MTVVISLFGGPGTGKSTSAAYIFAMLKMRGINAELVTEHAKEWAWEGRPIATPDDQRALLTEQCRRERRLEGKVEFIVTDSPVELCGVFAEKYDSPIQDEILAGVRRHRHESSSATVRVYLQRSKPYNPKGRFEDEENARDVDARCRENFSFHYVSGTDREQLDALVNELMCRYR